MHMAHRELEILVHDSFLVVNIAFRYQLKEIKEVPLWR